MLLVARWFQRLTTNSDIDELRKMAFSYRLGNTLALRAFLNEDGETLKPDSSLEEYQKGIVEPHFYKSTTNPPFYLALILVLSLGLFAFFAPILDLTSSPWIFLLGPELGDFYQNGPAGATPVMTAELAAYGARALVCLAFAFAGAIVWAVIYITQRMALRDITACTYQEVTMRLVASAFLSLVVYHIFASRNPAPGIPASELLMVAAFGAGAMPETVLRWLINKASRLFGAAEQSDLVDLENIQGITAFTKARLAEVGIYDAQGLVATNPLLLSMHTPYSVPQIMDWYGQAFILLYLQPAGLNSLRKTGIRTIWELRAAAQALGSGLTFGAETTLDGDVPRVLAALAANPVFVRSTEIHDRMRSSPQDVASKTELPRVA